MSIEEVPIEDSHGRAYRFVDQTGIAFEDDDISGRSFLDDREATPGFVTIHLSSIVSEPVAVAWLVLQPPRFGP